MKTLFDIITTLLGIFILSPILLIFALGIKIADGGPVFYRGVRVGLNGRLFRIFKFRTMITDAENVGASSTSDDDPRITRIGKFLRKYKLDELPQLLNVLKGDMSLVGPRPQVKWAVDLFNDEERQILSVRPGITDSASILFSNEGEILKGSVDPDKDYMVLIHPRKTRLNLEYVRNRSFFGDVKIIFQTIAVIFKKKKESELTNA